MAAELVFRQAYSTFAARPLKPARMLATPAASQTRVPEGRPIIAAGYAARRQTYRHRVRFNAHHHLTEVNLDQAGNALAGRRNLGDRDKLDRQQHSFSIQLTCPQLTAPPESHAGVQAVF